MSTAGQRSESSQEPGDRRRSRTALVSVGTSGALLAIKVVTAGLTGSLSVLASALDSLTDMVASGVNFAAVRSAEAPPDHDHRWGHGKAESVSGLAQAFLLAGSILALVWQSVARLRAPTPLSHVAVGVAVMVGSSVVSTLLALYLRRAGRRLHSIALSGDAAHYLSDGLTNSAGVAALLASYYFGATWVDPLLSFAVAITLGRNVAGLAKQSLDQLMDRELDEETRNQIREAVQNAAPQVLGVHALKTRRSGRLLVIEAHVELPVELSFVEAHHITARIEKSLVHTFGEVMAIIHPEPYLAPGKPELEGDP